MTGAVANVVFPTAVDQRSDLGEPNRIDVYYGMADSRIGVARTYVPEELPAEAPSRPNCFRQELHARAAVRKLGS